MSYWTNILEKDALFESTVAHPYRDDWHLRTCNGTSQMANVECDIGVILSEGCINGETITTIGAGNVGLSHVKVLHVVDRSSVR